MSIKTLLFLALSLLVKNVYAQNSCSEYLTVAKGPAYIYLNQIFKASEILEQNKISNIIQTLEKIEKILTEEPENLAALKAYWHVSRGMRANLEMREKQLDVVSRIIKIEGKTETNQYWLLLALMQSKRFKESFDIASQLVMEHFGTLKYRVLKVEALMGQNLFFDARDLATEYSLIYPGEIKFLELAAKANLGLADRSRSQFHFKAAEEILVRLTLMDDPKSWYFYSLLDAKLGQGKFQEIIDYVDYSGYSQIEGDGGKIMKYNAYMGLKDFDSASEIINQLLLENPESKRLAELRRRLTRAIKSDARGF